MSPTKPPPLPVAEAATEFGGLDILVSNAGLASSAPIEETTLALWNRNMDILATGYFLVSREAFKLFRTQNIGGNVVFVASKNGLAASPNASAYCTAKAAEIHLARCLALEGAAEQIRVNVVNPDAVLRGSKIWTGEWKEQRAAAYNMGTDELEEHCCQRSMLKRSVLLRHSRGHLLLRLRDVSQIDRQYRQRRCGQRAEFYAVVWPEHVIFLQKRSVCLRRCPGESRDPQRTIQHGGRCSVGPGTRPGKRRSGRLIQAKTKKVEGEGHDRQEHYCVRKRQRRERLAV